jgi:hypothetical protein
MFYFLPNALSGLLLTVSMRKVDQRFSMWHAAIWSLVGPSPGKAGPAEAPINRRNLVAATSSQLSLRVS